MYDPNSIYGLQIKQRLANELAGYDYKKTRWDVRFDEQLVSLSRFSNLCIANSKVQKTWDQLGLYMCTDVTGPGYTGESIA